MSGAAGETAGVGDGDEVARAGAVEGGTPWATGPPQAVIAVRAITAATPKAGRRRSGLMMVS
ncbi:hypothetical protein C3E87_05090 [Tessaracoccus sp. ZS01]|nr:hypothetical protein [Tessaracoccus sp. ZS01]OMG58126.1 hypothetical protein BJN44_05105 [Tessaracoccus sp. ZS01]